MQGSDNRYLLRLWSDGSGSHAWRASLKDLRSDESWHFGTIQQLLAHLKELSDSDTEGEREGRS